MKIRLKENKAVKKLVFLCSFFAVFFAFFIIGNFIIFRFKPVFEEKARYAAKNRANLILNSAVSDAFESINAEKFVKIMKDEKNTVTSISTDTGALNRIKTDIYKNLKKYSKNAENATVYIPIGSLTDYPTLQGVGYKIPVKILFDTSMEIDFSDSLKESGINQVYYEISVVASVNLDIISAFIISETSVTAKIPISQTLIIGTVPSSYGYGYDIARR